MLRQNIITAILLASLFVNSSSHAEKELTNLESLEWENRIILIRVLDTKLAPDQIHTRTRCEQTIETLKNAQVDIDDRNVVWFVICTPQVTSNYPGAISPSLTNHIEQRYFNAQQENSIVLIGKDGDVKYTAKRFDLQIINDRIDSMPMRQAEMLE